LWFNITVVNSIYNADDIDKGNAIDTYMSYLYILNMYMSVSEINDPASGQQL